MIQTWYPKLKKKLDRYIKIYLYSVVLYILIGTWAGAFFHTWNEGNNNLYNKQEGVGLDL